MSRLLVSTFFRMLRKIVFWILIISMFTYGVYSALNMVSDNDVSFVIDGLRMLLSIGKRPRWPSIVKSGC